MKLLKNYREEIKIWDKEKRKLCRQSMTVNNKIKSIIANGKTSTSMKKKFLLRQGTTMFQNQNKWLVMLIRKCWNKWKIKTKTRQKLNLKLKVVLLQFYHQKEKEHFMTWSCLKCKQVIMLMRMLIQIHWVNYKLKVNLI